MPNIARPAEPRHIDLLDLAAGEIERLLRPGHVGHDRRCSAQQKIKDRILHELRRVAQTRKQPQGHRWFVRAFERLHAAANLVQAGQRIFQSDRQLECDDAETVSQLAVATRRAQIDRHERTNFHAVRLIALFGQIAVERAGDGGEQHVVHRTAQRVAHRLDFGKRNGIGPCHPLDAGGLPLQAGGAVIRHEQQIGKLASDLASLFNRVGRAGHRFPRSAQDIGREARSPPPRLP